jgi:hypothetical protein
MPLKTDLKHHSLLVVMTVAVETEDVEIMAGTIVFAANR